MQTLSRPDFNLVSSAIRDHSLSPKIHNAALKACGLEGEYSLFPIEPDDLQGLKDVLGPRPLW